MNSNTNTMLLHENVNCERTFSAIAKEWKFEQVWRNQLNDYTKNNNNKKNPTNINIGRQLTLKVTNKYKKK